VFVLSVKNQAILAEDCVRYLGDGVALVAAVSKEIAEEAISLIKVEYRTDSHRERSGRSDETGCTGYS